MKKALLFAAFAVIAMTTSFAQDDDSKSSSGVAFGVKAGVNFSTITGDDAVDVEGRTSIHVGGVVRIPISELFAVQPEIVYSGQGFNSSDEDETWMLDYINLPVLADFTLAEGFSLQGGPQVGFNVSSKKKIDGNTFDYDNIEDIDFGFVFGAQYQLPQGLFFQGRYMLSVIDIHEYYDVKNSVFSLSVGWFFN